MLQAFASDTGAAAETVKKLLENPTPEAAAALLKVLPSLLPDDPTLADAMAAELGEGRAPSRPLENEDVDSEEWEIISVDDREVLSNEWNPEDHPRGGDSNFPQR